MFISRLKLINWRNFAEAEVKLTPRVFLIGPNASGKSNFLDAIRFLRDLALPGGFQKAVVEHRGGVSKIRCLAARRNPDVTLEIDLSHQENQPRADWRYSVSFSQDNNRNPILKAERVWKGEKEILTRPDDKDKADPARRSQTALEQVNENKEFREVAEFFTTVFYFHLVPQLIRKPGYFSVGPIKNDPFGSDFLERLAKTSERTRQARLQKISHAIKLAVPQLTDLEIRRDETTGVPHLIGKYRHWRPRGAEQSEEEFSDGTLRFIGLLWSLFEGEGPLLLEEPELSLNPAIVRQLAPLVHRLQRARRRQTRQVMISTHSPELLMDPGIGGEETLLLIPGKEGTEVRVATSIKEIKALLEAGMTIADAALPHTEPRESHQLTFQSLWS